jgi:hypothetical protein
MSVQVGKPLSPNWLHSAVKLALVVGAVFLPESLADFFATESLRIGIITIGTKIIRIKDKVCIPLRYIYSEIGQDYKKHNGEFEHKHP